MRAIAMLSLIAATAILIRPASAVINVAFVAPETYLDARSFGSARAGADKSVLRGIERHFEHLSKHRLPPSLTLNIDILDIDLAGYRRLTPRTGGDGLRIVTDATWPRIRLRYTLIEQGSEILSGEEMLTDRTYLQRGGRYGSDTLRYEKRLLDDWFTARIVERRPARND